MNTALSASNIRVFEAVARLQSVSRAADELGTSQPYVSKQIASLESHLKTQLFSRVGRRLYLTRSGEILQNHARTVVESLKLAEETLLRSAEGSAPKLRIATTTTGMYLVPEWLAGFGNCGSELDASLIVTNGSEVERLVQAGEADLGFVAKRPRTRSCVVNVVAEDSLVLAAGKSHPLASSFVTLEQLRGERFIVREPESATRALSEERVFRKCTNWKFRLQVNRIDAIKASVAEGIGISFISRRAIDRELRSGTLTVVPVKALDLRRPICMLTNPRGFSSEIATGLATYISQQTLS